MKSKLLLGLFGIGVLSSVMTVNAQSLDSVEEGSNSAQSSVTVGEVELPVYSVDINWENLQFDWSYNSETAEYEWIAAGADGVKTQNISIYDFSTGAKVEPYIYWNQAENYEFVNAKFQYEGVNEKGDGTAFYDMEEGKIPELAALDYALSDKVGYQYILTISLENDTTKTITRPTTGDTIGTITISIKEGQ